LILNLKLVEIVGAAMEVDIRVEEVGDRQALQLAKRLRST